MEPALVELLDHPAEELAREYVRLMEQAAQDDGDHSGREGIVTMRAAIYARYSFGQPETGEHRGPVGKPNRPVAGPARVEC